MMQGHAHDLRPSATATVHLETILPPRLFWQLLDSVTS